MKTLLLIAALSLTTLAHSGESKRNHSGFYRHFTLRMNNQIPDQDLDRIGSKLFNKETSEEIFPNCEKRNPEGACELFHYVLRTDGVNYAIYNGLTTDSKIQVDLVKLKNKNTMRQWKKDKRNHYYDSFSMKGKISFADDIYSNTAGDALMFVYGLYEAPYGLLFSVGSLIKLPFSIVIDTLSLPVMTINLLASIKYVRGHEQLIAEDSETIAVSNKKFDKFMDTLVSVK